jgi:hypothetical protein
VVCGLPVTGQRQKSGEVGRISACQFSGRWETGFLDFWKTEIGDLRLKLLGKIDFGLQI